MIPLARCRMMSRFLHTLLAVTVSLVAALPRLAATAEAARPSQPNLVMIFIDDMGLGDLSCYGNPDIETRHLDALAAQGVRFEQFTVASPICSPSRVGLTTGQYPARHRINSFLNSRQRNAERGMVDFLDPKVPTIARTFQNAGYATAHFGKWHMGGGRDVDDAPLPQAYGFKESLVSFEGLGDRLLITGDRLSEQSAKLGQGHISWVEKHQQTPAYVDRSIDFITRHKDEPFYLHLWLNDVHDGHRPTDEQLARLADFADDPPRQKYYAVLDAMDRELGRLIAAVDDLGLGEDTIIVVASDNGPTAWPTYARQGFEPPGSTGGFRGRKWSLYEGGIREPLIVRWTGHVPPNRVDQTTIVSAVDLFPTFCGLAGIDATAALREQGVNESPEEYFDGLDMSDAMRGKPVNRTTPLFWEYGRDDSYLQPALPLDQSPNLAVREGRWKLLMDADGSRVELYDLSDGWHEYQNRSGTEPVVRDHLVALLTEWKESLPGYVDQVSQIELLEPVTLRLQSGDSRTSSEVPSLVDADVTVDATLQTTAQDGVIVAHGGQAAGYALYVSQGRPHLTLRVRNQAVTASGAEKLPQGVPVRLTGQIGADRRIRLRVDGKEVAALDVPALINTQPVDGLDVGRDTKGNVGDYSGEFRFAGQIEAVTVTIRALKPAGVSGHLVTRWAMELESDFPLKEYPRPQFRREKWQNLNGRWQYAIRPKAAPQPDKWDGLITVPFAVESTLSGVKRRVSKDERLWYRRTLRLPKDWGTEATLHFGAVDWEARVWVNGREVVATPHRGGYDPFSLHIGQQLALHPELDPSRGLTIHDVDHEIVVSVWDPTSDGPQPRGKQLNTPQGIWYTPVTGIWQTVWIEPRGTIDRFDITPDVDGRRVLVDVTAGLMWKRPAPLPIRAVLKSEGTVVAEATGTTGDGSGRVQLELAVVNPRLWSPDDPFLYDLEISVPSQGDARPHDVVHSYVGMRKIELKEDAAGIERLFLNGQPLFQYGPLDQGWWPDGLYTAPTDQALRFDIQQTKELGFNMIRKHVKVEPDRWYFHCDREGILVWQDMPSGMNKGGSVDRGGHVRKGEPDIALDEASQTLFKQELEAMIRALRNHPSIVVWVPFNEGWGQHDTNEILQWTKEFDPTRLVGGPSGWEDRGFGDLLDMHLYPGPGMFPVTEGRASVLGEFGGLGLPVEGHTWVNQNNWGYRTYATQDELRAAYADLLRQMPDLIKQGLAAAVYTQTTDVEVEVNGLLTYDRALLKFDADELRQLHAPLYRDLSSPLE